MKKIILILIFFSPYIAYTQFSLSELKNKMYIEANVFTGSTWAHHEAIKYVMQYAPTGINMKFGLISNGGTDWQHDLKLPRYGIGYQYAKLGSKILGNAHSLYMFIESDIVKKKKFKWFYNLGAGVGFIDNPYNVESNPLNIVNGSITNAFLRFSTGANIAINKRHAVGVNGGLFHLSNGNKSLPNWGINAFYSSLTWKYKLSETTTITPDKNSFEAGHKQRVTIYASAGYKEERPIDGTKYIVTDVHVNYWRKHRPAFAWGAGATIFYDESSKKMLWRGAYENVKPLNEFDVNTGDYLSAAIHGGYMICMHPVYFSFELGVYVYSTPSRDILNRWLLEIYITHNIRVYTGLKSRLGKADFIEYGIAYDLFKK